MDMPYFAIVYATWPLNQTGFMFNGGLIFRICGFFPVFKYGRHACVVANVPLALTLIIKSNLIFLIDINHVVL
jgi:hypothetical protein